MRSIVLSLLLLLTGLFAGGAAHAQEPTRFPGLSAHRWIEPAALRPAEPPGRLVPALLRKCVPPLALQEAGPGREAAAFFSAADCGAPLQVGLDDRTEMIAFHGAPPVAVVAYRSPRNAVATGGSPQAWMRLPLRPPRA